MVNWDGLRKTRKYLNDPVYGDIQLNQIELDIINTPIFQRLRGLKQLAHLNFVFPGAEHSRFVHSLGVLYIMGLMTEHLFQQGNLMPQDMIKLRVAAMLHDIGHYPLSHTGEAVYGYCKDNEIANSVISSGLGDKTFLYQLASGHSKSAHHEQLGKYIIKHNGAIRGILEAYEIDPEEIGDIITGEIGSRNMVYSQLLHSSLDADRLDYLLRDSYQTGVRYGLVDLQYLVRLLMVAKNEKSASEVLTVNKKGQHVVEHYLMSRYFHYSQIIYNKTHAAFGGMIQAMFIKLVRDGAFMYNSLKEIQAHVNDYSFLNFNDASLFAALSSFYSNTKDSEFKALYEMYIERKRPKVVFNMKALYEDHPDAEFVVLKWLLKRRPEKISEIIGHDRWGYQISPLTVESIQGTYASAENMNGHEEKLREAVKLYDPDTEEISYLAGDKLSVISRLANSRSEFIRIFILEENGKVYDYETINHKIKALI